MARELLHALGHARFSVLGISGGGPYAMLMGEHLADRIDRVGIAGGLGPAWELHLFTRQWQVKPAAVKTETFLWHGELDATVPASMSYCHAEQIPYCTAEFLSHEGHFSLLLHHMERILSRLIP